MSGFTDAESSYLTGQRMGRLATVAAGGHPHVVPVGFRLNADDGTIEIGANNLPDRGQQRGYLRYIEGNPLVAIVVDDVASTNPWTPRGVSVRGRAEIRPTGGERFGPVFGPLWVRITPTWISSWGIEAGPYDPPFARTVG